MKDLILNLLKSKPSPREAKVFSRKLSKRNIAVFYMKQFHQVQLLLEPWIFLDKMTTVKDFIPFHRGILVKNGEEYTFSQEFTHLILNGNYNPVFNSTILDLNSTKYYEESPELILSTIAHLLLKENVNLDRFIITNDTGGPKGLINLQEYNNRTMELNIMEKVLKVNRNTLGMIMSVKDLDNFNSTLVSEKVQGKFPISLIRHGFLVKMEDTLENIDIFRLERLLTKSFGKELNPDYITRLRETLDKIIIAGDYLGAIIVTKEKGLNYLDKFSVDPETQGMGVADILWKKLQKEYPDLFWRSRIDNPVNKWYFDRSDGNFKLDEKWMLFFYGDKKLDYIDKYRVLAKNAPVSFSNEQK